MEGLTALPNKKWLCWQLIDSAFPTGGFAHSGGLEAHVQVGSVHDSHSLLLFIKKSLYQLKTASLPFVTAGFDKKRSLEELDSLVNAFTSNHVANRASKMQGSSLAMTAATVFGKDVPSLLELKILIKSQRISHFAPLFGYIFHELGLERKETEEMFVFLFARNMVSSAVRLNLVGPLQGQQIQTQLSTFAQDLLADYWKSPTTLEDICQTFPLLDLTQAKHDCLFSRLFNT